MLFRVWRISTAASPAPSTNAGISMRRRLAPRSSHGGTKPEAGSQWSRTDRSRISMCPSQKLGTERPQSETALTRKSHTVLRRTAEKTPAGIAMPSATRSDRPASSIVIGSLRATVHTTDSRVRMDSPRSPRSASPTQRRYWSAIGASSPYFWRISASPAASASVPPITRAGSPGIMRTPVKTIRLITNRVTIEIATRRIRKSSTGVRLVPGHPLDADQPVGHRPVALQVLGERHDVVEMVEVDDVAPRGDLVDRLAVELRALPLVADLARLVQERVDGLVADQRGVQAGAAGLELVDVAVRIHAPAPADGEGLELAVVVVGQRGGELARPERDVEAGLAGHPLDDLAEAALLRVVHDGELEGVAVGQPGRGEELLGLGQVAAGTLAALVVERADRGDRGAGRRVLAVPRHLVDGLAVEAQVEGLAHPWVVGERGAQVAGRLGLAGLVPLVDGHAGVAEAGHARHLEAPFLLQVHRVGRGHQVHDVDVARAQVGEANVVVGDDAEHDAVEVGLAGIEVVGRFLEHDAVLRHALDEGPRSHAHRRGGELVAQLVHRRGGNRHAGAVGEGGHQRGEGAF